jgi:hypothetical protein
MIDGGSVKSRGVASLFEQTELKKFVKSYLTFIFFMEIIIFLFCFMCQLEPIKIPFPWRYYFLASFLFPIALTFLLGIFVSAFNTFFFGATHTSVPNEEKSGEPLFPERLGKLSASLHFLKNAPFMLSLLALGIGTILFSHLDGFLAVMAGLGEKAIRLSIIGFGVVAAIATVFGIIWIIGRYKLEKLKFEYDYKREVMAQLGVIITDQNTVIDAKGKVISLPEPIPAGKGTPSFNANAILIPSSEGERLHADIAADSHS